MHELKRLAYLDAMGVDAFISRAQLPGAAPTRRFLTRLRDRDLHLEIHLEGPRLAPVLPALADQGVKLVIDHFGLPSDPDPRSDPMIRAVADLHDRSALYFKFAAHYRTSFDVTPHAGELFSLLRDNHVVWGSDWPHTQHEHRTGYADVWSRAADWRDLSDGTAARRLYDIG